MLVPPPLFAGEEATGFDAVVSAAATKWDVPTFGTVGDAIASAPLDAMRPFRIRVSRGRWHEKLVVDRPGIHLIGEDRAGSVLTFDAAAGMPRPDGEPWGTWGCASVTVRAPDFRARNLTDRERVRLCRQPRLAKVRADRSERRAGGGVDARRRLGPVRVRTGGPRRPPGHTVRRCRAQLLPRLPDQRQRRLRLRWRQRAVRTVPAAFALPARQGAAGLRRGAVHAGGPGVRPHLPAVPAHARGAGNGRKRGTGPRMATGSHVRGRKVRRSRRGRRGGVPVVLDGRGTSTRSAGTRWATPRATDSA